MSLKSTDMQNVIARTQEIGRVRQIQDRQAEISQRQSAHQFAEKVAQQTRQVPTSPQAHQAKIDRREEEKQRRQDKKKKKKGHSDSKSSERSGHRVDVKV